MSITKNLGRSATFSKPAASRPVGLGVWKVPSASQRSSHASSIRCASAGVYRCAGTSLPAPVLLSVPLGPAVWLIVSRSWSAVVAVGGQKKTPHAGGVAVLSVRIRSARPEKEEPAGHASRLPRTLSGASENPGSPRLTPSREPVTLQGASRALRADDEDVVGDL